MSRSVLVWSCVVIGRPRGGTAWCTRFVFCCFCLIDLPTLLSVLFYVLALSLCFSGHFWVFDICLYLQAMRFLLFILSWVLLCIFVCVVPFRVCCCFFSFRNVFVCVDHIRVLSRVEFLPWLSVVQPNQKVAHLLCLLSGCRCLVFFPRSLTCVFV